MVVAKLTDDREGVGLYRVSRPPSGSESVEDGQTTCHAVIPVTNVVQGDKRRATGRVDPGFRHRDSWCRPEVSSENCLQAHDEYYVQFTDVQR